MIFSGDGRNLVFYWCPSTEDLARKLDKLEEASPSRSSLSGLEIEIDCYQLISTELYICTEPPIGPSKLTEVATPGLTAGILKALYKVLLPEVYNALTFIREFIGFPLATSDTPKLMFFTVTPLVLYAVSVLLSVGSSLAVSTYIKPV